MKPFEKTLALDFAIAVKTARVRAAAAFSGLLDGRRTSHRWRPVALMRGAKLLPWRAGSATGYSYFYFLSQGRSCGTNTIAPTTCPILCCFDFDARHLRNDT